MLEPLYRIADRYRDLLENDDISHEDFSTQMDAVQDQLEHKIENCALFLANLDAQEKMLTEEMARLKARRDAIYFRKERMRAYVLFNLQRANVSKVKTALVSVSVAKGRESVVIDNLASVPDEFCKIIREPRKNEIKAHLESGNPLPGCHIERGPPYLLVR